MFYTERVARLILEASVHWGKMLPTNLPAATFRSPNLLYVDTMVIDAVVMNTTTRPRSIWTPVSYKVLEKITRSLSLPHHMLASRRGISWKIHVRIIHTTVYCVEINKGKIASLAVHPPPPVCFDASSETGVWWSARTSPGMYVIYTGAYTTRSRGYMGIIGESEFIRSEHDDHDGAGRWRGKKSQIRSASRKTTGHIMCALETCSNRVTPSFVATQTILFWPIFTYIYICTCIKCKKKTKSWKILKTTLSGVTYTL